MPDPDARYAAVAARRVQWDNLVWQVPLLGFTAQAFLFTIALGAGVSRASRIIASLLSLVITVLSMSLMARHRQAEIADAEWLEGVEKLAYGADQSMHGTSFQARRDMVTTVGKGWLIRRIPLKPMFSLWVYGLGVFGLAALTVLVLAVGWPSVLD